MTRVRLCTGDLELLLPCGRHDKYSGWKTKARINLWIRAVRSDYFAVCSYISSLRMSYFFTYVDFHGSAQIRHQATTHNSGISSIDYKKNMYVKIQKMQQSHSLFPDEETACS